MKRKIYVVNEDLRSGMTNDYENWDCSSTLGIYGKKSDAQRCIGLRILEEYYKRVDEADYDMLCDESCFYADGSGADYDYLKFDIKKDEDDAVEFFSDDDLYMIDIEELDIEFES